MLSADGMSTINGFSSVPKFRFSGGGAAGCNRINIKRSIEIAMPIRFNTARTVTPVGRSGMSWKWRGVFRFGGGGILGGNSN
jgi:hypothetical protein